jgi:hypothetical protein
MTFYVLHISGVYKIIFPAFFIPIDKCGIPAVQHRVFRRLKLKNFSMSPKVLREVIVENFEKLNKPELPPQLNLNLLEFLENNLEKLLSIATLPQQSITH